MELRHLHCRGLRDDAPDPPRRRRGRWRAARQVQGERQRLDRHHRMAWAFAVFVGRRRRRPVQRRPPEPGRHLGLARQHGHRTGTSGSTSPLIYLAGEFVGAMIGAFLVFAPLLPALGRDRGPGPQARGLLHRAGHPQHASATSSPRSSAPSCWCSSVLAFGGNARPRRPSRRAARRASSSWSIGLSLGGTTGYAINPARDLGPRIMHAILPIPGKGGSDWGYSWIPVVGPLVGGVLGGARLLPRSSRRHRVMVDLA